MSNIERAIDRLNSSNLTCVMISDTDIIISSKRGVAPLLELVDKGCILNQYSAADKVVGNGAAFLYILLGIKELFANIISKSAYQTLTEHGISVKYNELVDAIHNRDNTGFCPIETAVSGIKDPNEALILIKERLKSMQK